MDRENLAKALFTHVKNNDAGSVEKCLSRGDVNSWREIIRFELELLPMLDNVLKDNKLIFNLIQCTIPCLSPLHLAALFGHNDVLITFLDKDIPVDTILQTGSTPLHLASFGGHVSTVKLLLNVYKADAARQDKYGWTALHYASIEGNLELIKQLVAHGVSVNVRDKDGTCAALRAKWRGHEDVVDYFCRIGEEDELLNIDEDILNQNENEPLYSTVNKTNKTSTTTPQKPLVKSSSDKTLLEKHVPAPNRQASLPAGKSRKSTDASRSQTLPVRFKEARLSRIRRVIRSELEAAFSDYEQPIGAAGPTNPDEETEILMVGVGVQTMTKLMREEIQKYKDNIISPSGGSLQRRSPSIDVDNDVYEDHYQTLDQFGVAPTPPGAHGAAAQPELQSRRPETQSRRADTQSDIYKSFVPPPLPPRNRKPETGNNNEPDMDEPEVWDMNSLAETLRVPGQPTDMALQESIKKLSMELGGGWKALAKALPLAPQPAFIEKRVREIEKMYLGNIEKQTMVMLVEWRMNNGAAADVDALILALRKCGMKDKIAAVEKITQEFTA